MIVGLLSDIHGNRFALKQVLRAAKSQQVSKFLILGDLIGYYYDAKEVLEMLDDWDCMIIRGNHEKFLIDIIAGSLDQKTIADRYGSSLDIALKTLSPERINQIRSWPEKVSVAIDNYVIQLCHGSPWDPNQYIYPNCEKSLLNRCDVEGVHFTFLGHTHYPFIHFGRFSIVANPGSVGQSRVKGSVADWAIFDTERCVLIPRQTPYDSSQLRKDVKRIDPQLKYLHAILER